MRYKIKFDINEKFWDLLVLKESNYTALGTVRWRSKLGDVRQVKKVKHVSKSQLPLHFDQRSKVIDPQAPTNVSGTSAGVLKFPDQSDRKDNAREKAVSRIIEKAKKLPW